MFCLFHTVTIPTILKISFLKHYAVLNDVRTRKWFIRKGVDKTASINDNSFCPQP